MYQRQSLVAEADADEELQPPPAPPTPSPTIFGCNTSIGDEFVFDPNFNFNLALYLRTFCRSSPSPSLRTWTGHSHL
ncbi:hypothetical protein CPB83DRAFT_864531 [Crepidotus variabilis]|uniref:Uncharacterized protein n=1 Tax=Crepidotus variabilis TaxID=179855 RepID=A0A9P6E4M2_9AGAR|nr:hypothetical protein CPB83DRAFT_864531 [Crepidotus variabilis]